MLAYAGDPSIPDVTGIEHVVPVLAHTSTTSTIIIICTEHVVSAQNSFKLWQITLKRYGNLSYKKSISQTWSCSKLLEVICHHFFLLDIPIMSVYLSKPRVKLKHNQQQNTVNNLYLLNNSSVISRHFHLNL
jgi:hypothetical protein